MANDWPERPPTLDDLTKRLRVVEVGVWVALFLLGAILFTIWR